MDRRPTYIAQAACALLAVSTGGCVHTTTIASTPGDAAVYLGDENAPAGRTPWATARTGQVIRVQRGERAVSFRVDERFDPAIAAVNTAVACCGSAAILAGLGGGIYLLGTGLGLAMPVLGPIIAVFGAPPACFGTLLWSTVGGVACAALALPVQVLAMADVGPDRIDVDLERGVVVSQPPGRVVVVDGRPSSAPAAGSVAASAPAPP